MSEQALADTNKSTETNTAPIQIKLVLIGDAAVGKTSLAHRFANNTFKDNNEPTIGAAFLTQKIRSEGRTVKFEIWDTAGQERFASLAPMYYRNALAAVVVYDVTKAATFEKAKYWIGQLFENGRHDMVVLLAGNKSDLVAEPEADSEEGETQPQLREVSKEEATQLATEKGLLFFETSAKNGDNVLEIFTEIAKKLPLDSVVSKNNDRGSGLNSGSRNVDLLRNGGGAGAFNSYNEESDPQGASKSGCC